MKELKPLYATLPYFEGEWSVTFAPPKRGNSSMRSGYGTLPAEYAALPTIVFTKNENVILAGRFPVNEMPGYGGDLATYLNFVVDCGVLVRNWRR